MSRRDPYLDEQLKRAAAIRALVLVILTVAATLTAAYLLTP